MSLRKLEISLILLKSVGGYEVRKPNMQETYKTDSIPPEASWKVSEKYSMDDSVWSGRIMMTDLSFILNRALPDWRPLMYFPSKTFPDLMNSMSSLYETKL